MSQRTARREVRKTINQLSDDDIERVLNYARRLSKGSAGSSPSSLAEHDGQPSYVAAAGDAEYQYEQEKRNIGSWG
jgi:hypothetical protein